MIASRNNWIYGRSSFSKTKMYTRQLQIKRYALFSMYALFIYDLLFWTFSGYGGYGTGYENTIGKGDETASASAPLIGSIDNFFILLWISIISGILLLAKTSWRKNIPKTAYTLYLLLLGCNVLCYVRGCLGSGDYLTLKVLLANPLGGLSQFSPIMMIVGMQTTYAVKIFEIFISYLKFSLVLVPFQVTRLLAMEESYAHIVIPVTALLLLTPYLPYRKKAWVFVVAAIAFVLTIEWRTNELRLVAIFAFLILIYFQRYYSKTIYNIINTTLFCLPLFFVINAVTTGKTIFQNESHDNNQVTAAGQQVDLSGDTRTFLYTEVVADLVNNNSLIFGKGSSGKYKSEVFNSDVYKTGRANVEVGALKILLYSGVFGLIMNGLMFMIAAYYGTNRTNNSITKYFAFFLALHWMLLFIENMLSFDIYYYIIWLLIGLCLSKKFRQLSDADIKSFFRKTRAGSYDRQNQSLIRYSEKEIEK